MTAEEAVKEEGWYQCWFMPNYWCHFDFFSVFMWDKPLYWKGTAEDLCLAYGYKFNEE